jgi:hypothetical protein
MLAFRSVQQSNHCAREEFLYELKAGLRAAACGGRPRPPTTKTSGLTHGHHRRSITPPI